VSGAPHRDDDPIRRRQEDFYRAAEADRFEWLTGNPVVSAAERALLGRVTALEHARSILEVGCGEGATIATLRSMGSTASYTGFDCFAEKIAFCRERHPADRFVLADARTAFPFASGSFDVVLVRDVLHHLSSRDRSHVLREACRILIDGGMLTIVEGNASNPINAGYALVFAHERCMLETRRPRLESIVAHALPGIPMHIAMEEPSNLFRFVLHYRFGLPGLARISMVRAGLRTWSALVRRLSPRRAWAYSIVELQVRGAATAPPVLRTQSAC
jgi:SAM-dependent methyltransferase